MTASPPGEISNRPGTTSLDTNVLLRLIVPDMPDLHQRALSLVTMPGARFLVSDHVFVEVVFVLQRHYGLNRQQVLQAVETVMCLDNIRCNTATLQSALQFWASHPKLSFEDCLVAEIAKSANATPLWTFDTKLANQHPAAREV